MKPKIDIFFKKNKKDSIENKQNNDIKVQVIDIEANNTEKTYRQKIGEIDIDVDTSRGIQIDIEINENQKRCHMNLYRK